RVQFLAMDLRLGLGEFVEDADGGMLDGLGQGAGGKAGAQIPPMGVVVMVPMVLMRMVVVAMPRVMAVVIMPVFVLVMVVIAVVVVVMMVVGLGVGLAVLGHVEAVAGQHAVVMGQGLGIDIGR